MKEVSALDEKHVREDTNFYLFFSLISELFIIGNIVFVGSDRDVQLFD